MEQKDKFALRWDNYEKTIVEVFQKIRGDYDFYDCTLVCNGIKINAHRYPGQFVILIFWFRFLEF